MNIKHMVNQNRTLVVALLLLLALRAGAQEVSWNTRSTRMTIGDEGYFTSIQVEGKEIMQAGKLDTYLLFNIDENETAIFSDITCISFGVPN